MGGYSVAGSCFFRICPFRRYKIDIKHKAPAFNDTVPSITSVKGPHLYVLGESPFTYS